MVPAGAHDERGYIEYERLRIPIFTFGHIDGVAGC
jgi:hypothetical protein